MKKILTYILVFLAILSLVFATAATVMPALDPIFNFDMTEERLAGIVGLVLTVAFSFIPGLNVWYAAKSDNFKKLFMAGVVLLVLVAIFGLACAGLVSGVACTFEGGWQILELYALAVVINQSVNRIMPTTKKVKMAKLAAAQ